MDIDNFYFPIVSVRYFFEILGNYENCCKLLIGREVVHAFRWKGLVENSRGIKSIEASILPI
jgi:hypothetical protein